jgi:hypothetical protein
MQDGSLFVHKCARDAHEQITRLWDFMSPTIVAMWNLRWQVQGFMHAKPDATQNDLVQRFALGSGVRGNEIKRACIENSWEDQTGRFASILLTNTIAIFEEFLDRFVELTLSGDAKTKAVKALQYPAMKTGRNYLQAYAALGRSLPELEGVFNSGAALGRWYTGGNLQNLLLCYRFFKEIRNAGVHSGGRATVGLMDAYAAFQPIASAALLGVKEVPKHTAPTLNQVVTPNLRGVSAFSDVVLRLIATYDRDLSDRKGALCDIDVRLGKLPLTWRGRPVTAKKRQKVITGLLHSATLPTANQTAGFITFLKKTDRIPSTW